MLREATAADVILGISAAASMVDDRTFMGEEVMDDSMLTSRFFHFCLADSSLFS